MYLVEDCFVHTYGATFTLIHLTSLRAQEGTGNESEKLTILGRRLS